MNTSPPSPPGPPTGPRPRRRYPLSAYLPFTLLVSVPLVVLILLIVIVAHLFSPTPRRQQSAPPHVTATMPATHTPTRGPVVAPHKTPGAPATATALGASGTVIAGTATALSAPRTAAAGTPTALTAPGRASATRTPAPLATGMPLRPVIIAAGITANGAPLRPATVFHYRPIKLWAFVTIPNARAGEALRFVWHDLNNGTIVEDLSDQIKISMALFHTHMFAFRGAAPTTPFAPGSYRVDVLRDSTLFASGGFSIAPS